MKNLSWIVVVAAAAASAGCIGYERQSEVTGPSATGINALMGNWSSNNLIPTPSSCTNFKWNVMERTATSAKGSFSATCAGDLQVAGTAEGGFAQGSSSLINWQAVGTATAPGLASCAISLNGTAELAVDSIRIPYEGTTCLGRVSGVETLRK
jgi:hypothetical protein